MSATENPRPPFPPFDAETAAQKVRMAEDTWNTRDPERVSLAYTITQVFPVRSMTRRHGQCFCSGTHKARFERSEA